MLVCRNCKEEVQKTMYETGEESYCKCQCTLDAEFDGTLWELV